jgi:hypothetical protein
MGNDGLAIQHFTQALRLKPGFQPAEENLRKMQTQNVKGGSGDDFT